MFKLNRPIGLLLNHRGSVPDVGTCDHIADLDFDQIAASQFAIDWQVNNVRSRNRPSRYRKSGRLPVRS